MPDAPRVKRPPTAAETRQRQLASIKSGLYVKAPNGLRIRQRRVRRLVEKVQAVMPWLTVSDLPATRAWAEMEILGAYAFAELIEKGLTSEKTGEGRRLLTDYRLIRETQLRYETALGMTPASRMQLRVGDSKARSLDIVAQLAAENLDDEGDPSVDAAEPVALPGPDEPAPDDPPSPQEPVTVAPDAEGVKEG